ncbi:putative F-box domain-containing protein [Helianthus anomalus]
MDHIGDDMIFEEILTRLPAKAVCRFKCVSKHWCYELSTPKFVFIHTLRVGNSTKNKLLSLKENSIVVDDIVSGDLGDDTIKTVNFPLEVHPSALNIICSFNGLILLSIKRIHDESNDLVLWNPTTRRFKLISDDYFIRYFGRHNDTGGMYLGNDNDLKVLHINCYWDVVTARVYSPRHDSWRKLNFLNGTQFASNFYSWSSGVYSGKTIYFIVSNYWIPPGERNIVAFDSILAKYIF